MIAEKILFSLREDIFVSNISGTQKKNPQLFNHLDIFSTI